MPRATFVSPNSLLKGFTLAAAQSMFYNEAIMSAINKKIFRDFVMQNKNKSCFVYSRNSANELFCFCKTLNY